MKVCSGSTWGAPSGGLAGASLELRIDGREFNTAPNFPGTAVLQRYEGELRDIAAGSGVEPPVTAANTEGDTVTYTLENVHANYGWYPPRGRSRYELRNDADRGCNDGVFAIDGNTGQIKTVKESSKP